MIYTVTLNPAIDYVISVSHFVEGKLNKTEVEHKFPGGKGINVSRVLKQLGVPSTNLGFIGGFTGDFICTRLEEEALLTNFVTVEGDTRINIKLKSQSETEINGQGPVISEDKLGELKSQIQSLTPDDLLVLSGSIPRGVPSDVYVSLVQLASENKVPFVVDISSGTLFELLPYGPELIKPNHHELGELFQTSFESIEDMIPYGTKLVDMGAKHVLVSMGKDGAMLFNQQGVYRAYGLTGNLKNSVGSGDSMVAGFVSQYSNHREVIDAFRYGVAAGSATAFSDDLATGEAIINLLEQVNIETILNQ